MANNNHQIFIIDDEQKVCNVICETLMQYEINATCFAREKDCLKELKFNRCDLLITDLMMPETDGIELMQKARHLIPYLPVIVITGYGDIPTAVSAIKAGAVDFIEKPIETDNRRQN
jgi:two-component system C4-dicarboxylate transport response regulator DctD